MTDPLTRLPYVPGVPPPYQPPTPAVGFSASSTTSQTASVSAVGRTQLIPIVQNSSNPTQIISDTVQGQCVVQLLGGAPVWIGFSNTVTPLTGFRLVIDDPYTMRDIIPTWAVGLNDPDVPQSLVQVSIIEPPV